LDFQQVCVEKNYFLDEKMVKVKSDFSEIKQSIMQLREEVI